MKIPRYIGWVLRLLPEEIALMVGTDFSFPQRLLVHGIHFMAHQFGSGFHALESSGISSDVLTTGVSSYATYAMGGGAQGALYVAAADALAAGVFTKLYREVAQSATGDHTLRSPKH